VAGGGGTGRVWMVLAADSVCSAALLRRGGDTESLAVGWVLSQLRASSQSSTSR